MSARWLLVGTGTLAATLAPALGLLVAQRRLGRLHAASWLVIWGAVIAMGEHAIWAMRLAPGEAFADPHARVHYFMAGVYAALGAVFLGVIADTLLREGRRAGWYAVLFALLVGGGLEVVMNGPAGLLYQHGFSVSQSRPEGMGLFGYLFAWLAALLLAYQPIFRRRSGSSDSSLRRRRRPRCHWGARAGRGDGAPIRAVRRRPGSPDGRKQRRHRFGPVRASRSTCCYGLPESSWPRAWACWSRIRSTFSSSCSSAWWQPLLASPPPGSHGSGA